MAISASDVKALREQTGAGMMDCKKALTECDGNVEKAMDLLRTKGLAAAQKKQSRVASEGAIIAHEEGNSVVLLEANCETDFVAKNEEFKKFAQERAAAILASSEAVDLTAGSYKDESDKAIADLVNKLGEKITLRRYERFDRTEPGLFGTYLHGNRIGVMVEVATENDGVAGNEAVKAFAKDMAMQVAAADPKFVHADQMDEDFKNKEAEIYAAQLKEEGKPENMIPKIVQGKLNKLAKEVCLYDQKFIKDGDLSIKQLMENVAKEAGGKLEVKRFFKYNLGEGIEKREDNLAEEVAKMTGKA